MSSWPYDYERIALAYLSRFPHDVSIPVTGGMNPRLAAHEARMLGRVPSRCEVMAVWHEFQVWVREYAYRGTMVPRMPKPCVYEPVLRDTDGWDMSEVDYLAYATDGQYPESE